MSRLLEIAEELRGIAASLEEISANPETENAEERMAELRSRSEALIQERNQLIADEALRVRNGFNQGRTITPPAADSGLEERTRLGNELIQGRSITVGNGLTLVLPQHTAPNIVPTFNPVSSILDGVTYTNLNGGETYRRGMIKGYGEAGLTAEGAAATESDPEFGVAEIAKRKLTVYTEVSEEFKKLAPQFYYDEVQKNLRIAIQRKLAQQIVAGAGGSTELTGILAASNVQTSIATSKDLEIQKIDENTLDNIVLNYGGEEHVEAGVLILSKADLRAFKAVKDTTTKKSAYEIDYRNGTINGVPYVISSVIKPVAEATAGQYTMVYGALSAYEIGVFSGVEIQESIHTKFKEGMIALRANLMVGGNVVQWNGFLRTKKKTAAGA